MVLLFFFNDTATTEIYTLSLHDALPIWSAAPYSPRNRSIRSVEMPGMVQAVAMCSTAARDRKSTRLNSSHGYISYAVFCLKKKKNTRNRRFWVRGIRVASSCTGHSRFHE